MNYLDEYLSEQLERQQLSGIINESVKKRKLYKTLNDVPHNIWDDIVELLRSNNKEEADARIRDVYDKIKDLPDFEAKHFASALLRKALL